MSGISIRTQRGPRTYPPVEAITGGQLVEGRTASGGGIGVAAAASVVVVGVALFDGQALSALVTTPTTGADGRPVLNTAQMPTQVAVAGSGMEVPVTYSAAATFGQKLVCTGSGAVGPAGATPDARTIVGHCSAPAGVASAAVGLMVIK
jgi:hypothetical protein